MREETTSATLYKYDFSQVANMKRLMDYDRYALQSIAQAERLIEDAREYRKALAGRAVALEKMLSHHKVSLVRRKTNNVVYYLTEEKVFDDGTSLTVSETRYDGIKRHQAIKDFESIRKIYPGYEYVKSIDKSPWE